MDLRYWGIEQQTTILQNNRTYKANKLHKTARLVKHSSQLVAHEGPADLTIS